MARRAIPKEPGDIIFFSECDMSTANPDKIGSTYPAWFFTEQQRRLEEDIMQEEQMMKSFNLPEASKPVKAAKIRVMKDRLEKIKEAVSEIKPNRDKLSVMANEIGEKLTEIMYRRNDETKGLVSPHKVAEQLITPCVEVSGDIAKVAVDNGFQVKKSGTKGLMNLNEATRFWQITRAALGEEHNVESLRRD